MKKIIGPFVNFHTMLHITSLSVKNIFGLVFCAVLVTRFSLLEKQIFGKTGLSSKSEAQ